MNKENVIPYGKFNHEIATQYGSVNAFKESQKALINTIKKNYFRSGYSAGQKKLLPWLITSGIITISLAGYEGYKYIKSKVEVKRIAKAQLAEEAREAEEILIEGAMNDEFINEIQDEGDN